LQDSPDHRVDRVRGSRVLQGLRTVAPLWDLLGYRMDGGVGGGTSGAGAKSDSAWSRAGQGGTVGASRRSSCQGFCGGWGRDAGAVGEYVYVRLMRHRVQIRALGWRWRTGLVRLGRYWAWAASVRAWVTAGWRCFAVGGGCMYGEENEEYTVWENRSGPGPGRRPGSA